MLLDDPEIMGGGEGSQALGKQVVAREAGADLDEVAGLAEVRNRVGQQDLHVPVLGAHRVILAALHAGLADRRGSEQGRRRLGA